MNDLPCRLHRQVPAAWKDTETHPLVEHQPGELLGEDIDDATTPGEFGDIPNCQNDEPPHQVPVPVVDTHPNIPSLYPGGTTFMDGFLNDQYSTL